MTYLQRLDSTEQPFTVAGLVLSWGLAVIALYLSQVT